MSMVETDNLPTDSAAEQSVDPLKYLDEYLAGLMFDERSLVVLQLALKEQVWLKRQPNNLRDSSAIVAERKCGTQIGYVRRDVAAYLTPHMDKTAQPVEATITELSCDATGSSCRVRVRFCVPLDWLKPQRGTDEANAQSIEYYYDDSGINTYVLLNCSEESFNQIRETLTSDGLQCTRHGLCYRPASNGRQYQWYVRIDKTPDLSGQTIEEFFKRQFKLTPEHERIDELEEKSRRAELAYHKLAKNDKSAKRAQGILEHDLEKQKNRYAAQLCAMKEEIRRLREKAEAESLRQPTNPGDSSDQIPEGVRDVFTDVIGETLTPYQTLLVISKLFPSRIAILDSAWKSAKDSKTFPHKKQLFQLLWKLVNEYWYNLANGKGDAVARFVFGDNYAAKESERVENNRRLRMQRTFPYNGRQIEMMKHLKIGIKESPAETIRVHFEWEAREQKVLIGWCGHHR
jgi:hypothetical protein